MRHSEIIDWLLQGDVSIQYQVQRDLLGKDKVRLQKRIATEGWGARFLAAQREDGHWGIDYYQPKWTSTHYTLFDLRNLCLPQNDRSVQKIINRLVDQYKGCDGGMNPTHGIGASDVCINGMFLNFASYFGLAETKLKSIIDFILGQIMEDGGFNCRSNRSGAVHSSLHTTLSILEGIDTYLKNGYSYQSRPLRDAKNKSDEFILLHQLFLSDRTGKIINKDFLRFPYPRRWRYDVLSCLDYFQYADVEWDHRMRPALDLLLKSRKQDGRWNVNAKYPGKAHFEMEKAGKPSRWNTLRALRVLSHFGVGKDK